MNIRDFPLYHYHGPVTYIVDGDTFDMDAQHGFEHLQSRPRIRVMFADAPEERGVTRALGKIAEAWLTEHLLGKMVYVHTHKDGRNRERWLAEVWYAPNAGGELRNLAIDMIADGMAVPTDQRGRPITTGAPT